MTSERAVATQKIIASTSATGLRRGIGLGAWALLILALLAAVNMVSLRLVAQREAGLDVGFWGDQELLDGFFAQETDATGASYRWTGARNVLALRGLPTVRDALLTLQIGGLPAAAPAPRALALAADGEPWTTLPVVAQARRYALLLPPATLRDGTLTVILSSDTSATAPDIRSVGVRLDAVTLAWPGARWPLLPWGRLLTQWAIVLLGIGVAWRLRLSWRGLLGSAAGLVVLLGWTTRLNLFMAAAWQDRLLGASAVLLLLAWLLPGLIARVLPDLGPPMQRRLALLTLAAISVRLLGVLYPPFGSHDLGIHLNRLDKVLDGNLLLIDKPAEFGGRVTIVPPAFYVLAAPLTLALDKGVALQGFYALLDGLAVLLAALLTRALGGSGRAAFLAALALACLPMQLTALWWGFGPQVVGQMLMLLLAVLAARSSTLSRGVWLAAALVFSIALLMHIGVALLGGVWLAAYAALRGLEQRRVRVDLFGWEGVLLASGIIATALLYAAAARFYLGAVPTLGGGAQEASLSERVPALWNALLASARPLGLALAVPALALLLRRTRAHARLLASAWLLSVGMFIVVELAVSYQVRYAYFAAPLVCAALGVLLDRLLARGWGGRLAAWACAGLIAAAGMALWYNGIINAIKPSLVPLTH